MKKPPRKQNGEPAGDFKCGAKDLSTNELRHYDGLQRCFLIDKVQQEWMNKDSESNTSVSIPIKIPVKEQSDRSETNGAKDRGSRDSRKCGVLKCD